MFEIEVCDSRRIVLIHFLGELSEAHFETLEALARARQGGDEYDAIFDLTAVPGTQLTTDFVSKRGQLPQIFQDRARIYVVPQDDLKLLVRLYAAYQAAKGWRPPVVLETVDEALERLDVERTDFRSIALPVA